MSDGSSNHETRREQRGQIASGEIVVQECLNPRAEQVIIQGVYIGSNVYGADAQPSTSKIQYPRDDDKTRATECKNAIRSILKNLYQKITLPALPWIEKEDLPIQSYTKLQLELGNERSEKKIIALHNLFDVINKEDPKRILIESQPGFGKTTLAHKIVNDWVNDKEYVSRFKFVFFIVLRHSTLRTLKDEMIEIISGENRDKNDMWRIINSEETLLIVDGLDEVSESMRHNIVEILCDAKNEYKMTIVTTCRIGLSRLNREQVESKSHGVSVKKEFWTKKITILGINVEDQEKFLVKFIDDDEKAEIMPRLCGIIGSRKEMFRSPLMLILLVYVTRENHDIKIKTNTDLYKQFFDYTIRRSISKTNPEKVNEKFTLFGSSVDEYSSVVYRSGKILKPIVNFESSVIDYASLIHEFGEMSLEHILKDDLQFDYSAESEAIHQLGFLLKHEIKKPLDTIIHYEGFHLSILEFAASAFLKQEFQANQNCFCDNLIEKIVEIIEKKAQRSLVIPFLCGLLGNNVVPFFNEMARYHVGYWIEQQLKELILEEYDMSESIMTELIMTEFYRKLVPPYCDTTLEYCTLQKANQFLQIHFCIVKAPSWELFKLTKPLYARVLYCESAALSCYSESRILMAAKNMRCEFLVFELFDDSTCSTLMRNLKFFVNISCDHKTLYVHSWYENVCVHLEKDVDDCVLIGSKFDLLVSINWIKKSNLLDLRQFRCVPDGRMRRDLRASPSCSNNDRKLVETIKKIINQNQVVNFGIVIDYFNSTSARDFLYSVAKNNCLKSISIYVDFVGCGKLCLDLDKLLRNAGKNLDCLFFHNVDVECKAQVNSHRVIKSLSINTDSKLPPLAYVEDVILSMMPIKLQCNYRALEELDNNSNASSWGGWDSVVELTLTLNTLTKRNCLGNLNYISKFTNLECLTLELVDKCRDVLIVLNVLERLSSLKLNLLEIRILHECYYDFIFRKLQNLIQHNSFKSVTGIRMVIMWDGMYNGFNFESTTSALQCHVKIRVYFLFLGWSDTEFFVKVNYRHLSHFNIRHKFIENNMVSNPALNYPRYRFAAKVRHFHELELTLH